MARNVLRQVPPQTGRTACAVFPSATAIQASVKGHVLDSALKQETEATLKSMGLNMSTAINIFCRQVVNQGRIPFDIAAPSIPNAAARQTMDDTLAGKNLSRSFVSVDEMWANLNA